jgi:hypothetical protein
MKKIISRSIVFFAVLLGACLDPYNPPAIANAEKYLVVDGFINSGQGKTTFKLSYTRDLGDTVKSNYPIGKVYVEGESAGSFELLSKGNGIFEADQLTLNPSEHYRLHIKLTDGKEYYSEFVEVKSTPAIDELAWEKSDDGVKIFVSSHDGSSKTRYYQWKYNETWEFHSAFYSSLKYQNKEFVSRTQAEEIYTCYQSDYSKSIAVGSSELLEQDIIHKFPLLSVSASNSDKLSVRYSVLVQQYAITKEAFQYWNNLKKVTEDLGSLFDPQPSVVIGNLKNVQDPSEPVIGFVSVSSAVEKRIYISRAEFGYTTRVYTGYEGCEMDTVPGHGTPPKTFQPSAMIPLYEARDNTGAMQLYVGSTSCVDCSLRGTKQKPDFW